MNGAVVKKTQDTLGRVIKKPPLTEKLLSKPPFRYLHDIFSEVIRSTGFLKGLYVENEMKSDNVKDKDSKIAFLQKAIDVVMLVSGEPLAAKPARIVAGHEPEKTNELLQAIAKCCLNKLSSDDAVKRVLSGEKVDIKTKASTPSRSQDKENREGRERHADREEKKKITERSGSRDQKDPDQPKERESRRGDGDRERSDKLHRSGDKEHHAKDKSRDRERDKDKERAKDRDKDKDKDRDRARDRDREKDKERDKDREKTRDRDSHRERDRDKEKRRDKDKERERHKDEERNKSGDSKVRVSEEPQQKPEEPQKTAKPVPASDSPARIPRPSSAKGQRRRPKIGGQDESDSEGDGDAQLAQRPSPQENGDAAGSSLPSDMAPRRIPRPSSARPAPPRVKRQESGADVNPAERLSSAKPSAAVILDGKRPSDDEEDEDEQFVVEEAVPPPPDAPEMQMDHRPELDSEDKHGGLVKRILETKKDYETSPSSPKSKEQSVVSEAAWRKERDLVMREIERLGSSIQTVCCSTLPLGKIMEYIQEDMDAMQAELNTWRRENKEHAQALQQEQRETDRVLEPLKVELTELEQQIKDQQDKNSAVRANILKSEERIQKMMTGINFSRT